MVKRDKENGENEAHIPGMAFTHFTRAGKIFYTSYVSLDEQRLVFLMKQDIFVFCIGIPTVFALAKVFDLGGRMTFSDMETLKQDGKL